MYIKLIDCILNLVFLGVPRIFIFYILERSYVLLYFVIRILKSVRMLYTLLELCTEWLRILFRSQKPANWWA